MNKPTKCCTLTVHLVAGPILTGEFHIAASTSSAIRPSDALQDNSRPWILLSGVSVDVGPAPATRAVLVPTSAIAFIELPSKWN